MPLRNRVTPLGELIADPARGLVYGNRGCLHDEHGQLDRRHSGRRWIACQLRFRGRRRAALLQPGRYTELFFLDEATAFAAGHRPCAECRRPDYVAVCELWSRLHPGQQGADAIDAQLHAERLDGSARRLHRAAFAELPDGAFVLHGDEAWMVVNGELAHWTPAGYDRRVALPSGETSGLITPPSLVAVLRHGWHPLVPLLHPTAEEA